ncbi:MAG: hypothetical protein LBU17_11375 [Treponema sp.]|jgi:hypothetical protein|nr:hypothetical protein [Treponema sp.]
MSNYFIVFLSILMVFSCTSFTPLPEPSSGIPVSRRKAFWDSTPNTNELIFLGVAGDNLYKQKAITLALEDAARRVAFYQSVGGTMVYHEGHGIGFLDFRFDSDTTLDYDQDYRQYIAYLHFDPDRDVFEENQSVFVRTRYRTQGPLAIKYNYVTKNGTPRWINKPPTEIAGYLAGVGFAGPRMFHKDTVIASYENAVFDIVKSVSSRMYAKQEMLMNSMNTTSVTTISGMLRGFYVLETWTNPKTQAVWTLAIAREGK